MNVYERPAEDSRILSLIKILPNLMYDFNIGLMGYKMI